jgi:predicted enzyme related to lactoylglutathione lyase
MLRGLATVSFFADDLAAATRWYTEVLDVEPYFVRPEEGPPAYVEFRFGDLACELGLIDRRYAPHPTTPGPTGAVIFWHVDDVPAAVARLVALGATVNEPVTPREAGFVTASVVDPFGNIVGVMYNPHYLQMLGERAGAENR